MWQVKSEKEAGGESEIYHIIIDDEVTVGRKNNDIIIKDDQSVSRKHAVLRASHPISNLVDLKSKPMCTLKDNSSKYGTFVNGKLIGDHGTLLKHGDLITFGQCGSNFRVSYTPMVIASSCLEPDEKLSLKEVIRKLGGHVVDEWNTECTHLAMTKVKVTVKTVCALVSKRPIVLSDYFKMLLENYKSRSKPEDVEKFLPAVNEVLLNEKANFHIDPNREHLFKDKTFIFLSVAQFKKLRLPVTLAGGKAVLMNRSRCDVTPELLLSSCVIECTNVHSQSQTCSTTEIDSITSLLHKEKKRLIPESDIGLAVVHCSTEQHCNPDFEFDNTRSTSLSNEVFKLQSQTLSQNFVYAAETLLSTQSLSDNTITPPVKTTIPSSLKSDDAMTESDTMMKASSGKAVQRSTSDPPKTDFSLNKLTVPSDYKLSSSRIDIIMETETCSTSKGTGSITASELSSARIKRPAVNENGEHARKSKREKLDSSELKSLCPDDIKVEPPSPPPQKIVQDGNRERDYVSQSLFDADTQPTSQTLFKDDSENIEFKLEKPRGKVSEMPVKRQLNNSDVHSTKKLKLTLAETTSIRNSSYHLLPTGYINSKISNNTSKIVQEKAEENEDMLCRSLRIVKIVDLVVKTHGLPRQNKENINVDSPVKNFKKFKKSSNFGANRMPLIIGGTDLIVHTCKENLSELNEFLQNQDTENTQPSIGITGNTSFRANFKKQAKVN